MVNSLIVSWPAASSLYASYEADTQRTI